MRTFSRLILGSSIIVATGVAGCAPAAAPSPSATAVSIAAPSSPPDTLVTFAPTETPGSIPNSSASATPFPRGAETDFSGASIHAVAHLKTGQLQVTITVPGGVKNVYNARLGGSRLPCVPLDGYPDRLYCIGAEPATNYHPEAITLELYPLMAASDQPPLFQATFTLPAQSTPTTSPAPWYPPLPDLPIP
ncbi:MAG: hypothetical protein WBR18_07350 [Anaerolineales bacterium]